MNQPHYLPAREVLPEADGDRLRRLADAMCLVRDRLNVLAHAKDHNTVVHEQLADTLYSHLAAIADEARELAWIEEECELPLVTVPRKELAHAGR